MQASKPEQPAFPPDQESFELAQRAFNADLASFQGEVAAAKRDGKNPHFRASYATLASVLEAIKPACKYGLSHTQTCLREGDQVVLVTTLRHKGGFEIHSELPLAIGNDWQRFGSAYTYARRYALMGIYGIASSDDDDDAAAASKQVDIRRSVLPAAVLTVAPASPDIEQRSQAVTHALSALHEADPDAIKPLVEEYRAQFKVPVKTPVARTLDRAERLAWFEQRLGLVAAVMSAPADEQPA